MRTLLTFIRPLGNAGLPNQMRRIRRLCHCSLGMVKRADFLVSCHQYILFSGCGYILARRRPGVREAPAAHLAGERRLAFFCARRSNPIQMRRTMFSLPANVGGAA